MNEEQQKRVGFEVWYRGRYCLRLSDRAASIAVRINPSGEYDSYHVREAWEIWQAALASDARVRKLERTLELFKAATSQELHERIAEIMKEGIK